LDYGAPELIEASTSHQTLPAAFSMDMYAIGRIIMWLSSDDGNLWPDLPDGCTDQEKEDFLVCKQKFTLDSIVQVYNVLSDIGMRLTGLGGVRALYDLPAAA
jgi:hypothetical protein